MAQPQAYLEKFLADTTAIAGRLDRDALEGIVEVLLGARARGGRLFFVGSGGGAGHASHAVCDFRKIGGFEAYSPSDNVSELTARINDDGWDTSYVEWLKGSRLGPDDVLFVFSVGGGDLERGISPNLVNCVEHARAVGAAICGVVGRDGGHTARNADACVVIPTVDELAVTPHTEAWQAVVWHMLVAHPALKMAAMKWESER
ncbi:MAG: SIS domain-containing protein [Gaiellaceae bacterium]